MIRLSVTDLESFRYWKADEDASAEALVARLKHAEPPTPQMAAGKAFAKLFENAKPGELFSAEADGWSFDFSRVDAELPQAAHREVKGELEIATPSGPVVLVGKVDGFDGLTVRDQKLTEKWDAERYTDSLQWRAYLLMFGARAFTYDVFLAKYDLDDGRRGSRGFDNEEGPPPANWVEIREYHPVTFYAYPGLREDVERAVAELAAVVADLQRGGLL